MLSKMTCHLALGSTKQAVLELAFMKVRELAKEWKIMFVKLYSNVFSFSVCSLSIFSL